MVSEGIGSAVLMAIKPCYSSKIFDGSKCVEFRKQAFRKPVTHVVVYESGATGKIVGFFEVTGVDEGTPSDLWERYSGVGSIGTDAFWSYFGSRQKGVAIHIGNPRRLVRPVGLRRLGATSRAPQSFVYLGQSEFARLRAEENEPVA
jgi:predicted transcriptional regulator